MVMGRRSWKVMWPLKVALLLGIEGGFVVMLVWGEGKVETLTIQKGRFLQSFSLVWEGGREVI